MTAIATTSLLDIPHAIAVQHIRDLRVDADRRHGVPTRPVLARTRRSVKAVVRFLWEGQLALVPRHLVDPAPPCTSC